MDSGGGGSGCMDSGGSGNFSGCIGVDGVATSRVHCVDVVLRHLFGKTILDNRYTEL